MQTTLLPLFPLPLVVFPRTQLPLHIFEDRYKDMVAQARSHHSEFGIVQAKENGIVNAGCTVVVNQVLKEYADGRLDILTSGVRRFEISFLDEAEPVLRGEVEYFDDDDPGPAPQTEQFRALEQYREYLELGEPRPFGDPVLTDPQLSFQLAQGLQDVDFLQTLLRNRSEIERLKQVHEFLSQYVPRQRLTARIKRLAPTNGHGQLPHST